MDKDKLDEKQTLRHVQTRISPNRFEEFKKLLGDAPNQGMSGLVRNILENKTIKVFTYDRSLDIVMEELAALRAEIKAIGVNINQITRLFNTYPSAKQKEFYGKIALDKYISLESKIERALEIISKLSNRWLSE